ncbi:putative magnesium transporter NIPA2 [Hordeum vulgare]|nr:putative magnesium transporter NIPA2 [Hordeum vulgare]
MIWDVRVDNRAHLFLVQEDRDGCSWPDLVPVDRFDFVGHCSMVGHYVVCTFIHADSLSVYGIALLIFTLMQSVSVLVQYRWIAYTAISIGCCFVVAFLIGTKEPGLNQFCRFISSVLHAVLHITVILDEVANFAAYAFAPAILVTPLGALSIIFSAVLAHFILNERLHMFGVVGCALCVVGSVDIVLHAPMERKIDSVSEIWQLATEPGFIVYSCLAVALALVLMFWVVHHTEQRKMLAYVAICSLSGSLTVISVKAVANALKLSFNGVNQFVYIQTCDYMLFSAAELFKQGHWCSCPIQQRRDMVDECYELAVPEVLLATG